MIEEKMIWKDLPRCGRCQLLGLAQFAEMEMEGDTVEDIHTGEQVGAHLRGIAEGIQP